MSKYAYWLANVKSMTPYRISMIRRSCPAAEEIYGLEKDALKKIRGMEDKQIHALLESKKIWDVDGEWAKFQEKGIGFASQEDPVYPQKLISVINAPYAIYYIGKLPEQDRKSVAIVGARVRSAYGSQIAGMLAEALARTGVDVISGMAIGIDTDSHMGALKGGGKTYAVLGCGVDVCYPKTNRRLYEKITMSGAVISEFIPGTVPQASFFPRRNRMISGLSDYTVVIEAKKKSGSLITADFAMEQGREVYALPGRITDPLSEGCNHLIQQGAGMIIGIEDFLKELELDTGNPAGQMDFRKKLLEKDELLVYSLFDFCPMGLGTLMEQCPFGLKELLNILERLEHKGFIKETIPNYFVNTV